MKESHKRGLGIETIDHSDEEVEDEANVPNDKKEEDSW